MNRKLIAGLLAASLWGGAAGYAAAASPLGGELYGQGVHAYNSSKFDEANKLFTEAVEQGSRDPRVFFYRGLVYSRTGRPELAEADFKQGATLEVTNDAEIFNVGKALERVQGADRLTIERYRRTARVTVVKEQAKAERARFEEAQANEDRVIRKPMVPAVELPPLQPMPMEKGGGADPFDKGVGVGETEKAPDKPMEGTEPTEMGKDPFAKPTPNKPAENDPFGGGAKDPMTTPPMKAGGNDPFGGEDTPAKPPMKAPAEMPEPADPFGGGTTPAKPPVEPGPGPGPMPMASGKQSIFGKLMGAASRTVPDPTSVLPKAMKVPGVGVGPGVPPRPMTAPPDFGPGPGPAPGPGPGPAPEPKLPAPPAELPAVPPTAPPMKGGAADDPFGASGDTPAPPAKPAPTPTPAADPFGASGDTPAAPPAKTDTKPAPMPKPPAADDDPFGN